MNNKPNFELWRPGDLVVFVGSIDLSTAYHDSFMIDLDIMRMMRTSKEYVKANKQFKGD